MNCVVVGNARPTRDYSAEIDANDFVIRFNHVPFVLSTRLVGTKTSALVLQNMDEAFRSGKAPKIAVEEYWILAENAQRDFSNEIALTNNLPHFTTIYTDFLDLKSMLDSRGGSAGFTIIEHLLRHPRFRTWGLSAACFTWEGWAGHDWKNERGICQQYILEGKMRFLSP